MFQLVLDKKQVEEMLILGLAVSGFQLANKTVTWDKKNGRPIAATVRVLSMRRDGKGQATASAPQHAATESPENAGTQPAQEASVPMTVIPDQDMSPEEVDRVLSGINIPLEEG